MTDTFLVTTFFFFFFGKHAESAKNHKKNPKDDDDDDDDEKEEEEEEESQRRARKPLSLFRHIVCESLSVCLCLFFFRQYIFITDSVELLLDFIFVDNGDDDDAFFLLWEHRQLSKRDAREAVVHNE